MAQPIFEIHMIQTSHMIELFGVADGPAEMSYNLTHQKWAIVRWFGKLRCWTKDDQRLDCLVNDDLMDPILR